MTSAWRPLCLTWLFRPSKEHLARPKRTPSIAEDLAQDKEYDYEEEENDEDYLGDDRDYYDA